MSARDEAAEARARLASPGGWGSYGSSTAHERYLVERTTHLGRANGVALTSGCELSVRRWVRDGR